MAGGGEHVTILDGRYAMEKSLQSLGLNGTLIDGGLDTKTGRKVAFRHFNRLTDEHYYDLRDAARLVKLLSRIQHINIVRVLDLTSIPWDHATSFSSITMVCNTMDTTLYQVLRSPQPITHEQIAYFAFQLFNGLAYLHERGICHRNLQTQSILLDANCDLRIGGLGDATLSFADGEVNLEEYVGTRWYRSPESFYLASTWTEANDMWSAGAILGEMYARDAIMKGRDQTDQFRAMVLLLGITAEEIDAIPNASARKFIKKLPRVKPLGLSSRVPTAHPLALNLMQRLLVWTPSRRPSAAACLTDSFFVEFGIDDPEVRPPVTPYRWEQLLPGVDETKSKSNQGQAMRRVLFDEMLCYHPELWPEWKPSILARGSADFRRTVRTLLGLHRRRASASPVARSPSGSSGFWETLPLEVVDCVIGVMWRDLCPRLQEE